MATCRLCGRWYSAHGRKRRVGGGYCSVECRMGEHPDRENDRHDCTDYEECLWKSDGPCVCDGCTRFAKRPRWVDLVKCASPGSNANWMG